MKTSLSLFASVVIVALAACERSVTPEQPFDAAELQAVNGIPVVLNLRAHLSGDQEVPPRETLATGQAVFQLSKDATELSYKLIVANIENVSMAHIHVAPPGVNGGIVTWLYPAGPPAILIPGTTNGILRQGVITSANLTGALTGQDLSALVELIKSGDTYVNVHTSQFGGGEIRGQIR